MKISNDNQLKLKQLSFALLYSSMIILLYHLYYYSTNRNGRYKVLYDSEGFLSSIIEIIFFQYILTLIAIIRFPLLIFFTLIFWFVFIKLFNSKNSDVEKFKTIILTALLLLWYVFIYLCSDLVAKNY